VSPEIRVSAAIVRDAGGRALVVRKSGTAVFMQPGGKPEPGESPTEALVRELREEVGLEVTADDLRPLGVFRAAAANEPGHVVVADAFALHADPASVRAAGEIAELRWISASDLDALPLAPLSRDLLLPLAFS
jgi:8-oxo-dGTP diphosphatase